MKTLELREYQRVIVDHLCDRPRVAVWAGMGLGKTSSTLAALDILELVEPGPTLVLAPKRVATSTWPGEVRKWGNLRHLEVVPIVGDPDQRRAALRRDAPIFAINYDNIPWLVETLGERWPFRKVVADESTRLKGFRMRQGGVRAQALARVAHKKVGRFIELTGTPSPNGLIDLWGQAWFLDAGERLGRSFRAFTDRWFAQERYGPDPHDVKLVPRSFAQEQIEGRLRDLCLSLDARDWFDLREPIVTTIRVELPKKARAIYEDMEREMFAQIAGSDVEAFNAASRTIKCLQIANGAIYTDEASTRFSEVHDLKIQALESIVEECAGAPLLVAYHFKHDLARLLKAFPRGRHLDDDPSTIDEWNAGRIPILFAHPASAGHGLSLQDGGHRLAFFSHWWSLEERLQIVERIGPTRQAQSGYDRPVYVYNIVATDTVDELVMARVASKREVQDLLLEAMKRKTNGRC